MAMEEAPPNDMMNRKTPPSGKKGKGKGRGNIDLTTETPISEQPANHEKKADDLRDDYFRRAQENMTVGEAYWDQCYEAADSDLNFAYVQQWDKATLAQREGRPCLTLNVLPENINQIVGKSRKQKYSVKVSMQSGRNSDHYVQGTTRTYTRAEIMDGIIRDIEQRSRAPMAYARALQHAVEGGFGWLMVSIKDDPNNPFTRNLHIKHIRDRFSAMIDPTGSEMDYSDAQWCSEARNMGHDDFKARWPEAAPVSAGAKAVAHSGGYGTYNSQKRNIVRVVHYWCKVPVMRTAIQMLKETEPDFNEAAAPPPTHQQPPQMQMQMPDQAENEPPPYAIDEGKAPPPMPLSPIGQMKKERMVVWADEVSDVMDELKAEGWKETDRKKVKTYQIKYMIIGGQEILEGPYNWPSMFLPIVPVIGRYIDTREGEGYAGLVRYAQDGQRMLNYHMSAATEKIGLSPKSSFILTADQIAGHESEWSESNVNNNIFLKYNHEPEQPPPRRDNPQAMAPGELQMVALSRDMLRDNIGIHEASLGRRTNEVSGVAIQERDAQSEVTNHEFTDNTLYAVQTIGNILVDMIPRIYTEETTQRIILSDGNEAYIELNRVIRDRQSGRDIKINSLDLSRYTCTAQAGAETKTQREAFLNMIVEIFRGNPELLAKNLDLILEHSDIPGGGAGFIERAKRMQDRSVLSPEEQARYPETPPTPEQQAEILKHQASIEDSKAKIAIAEMNLKAASLKVQGGIAGRDRELIKGINNERDQQGGSEQEGLSPEQLKQIKEMIAEALANRPGR